MNPTSIAQKTFSWDDQNKFARLSGDFNPMHMDAVFARRTQAGRPVVHGVHCLMWALDSYFATYSSDKPLARIQCKFSKLVYVEQQVDLYVASQSGDVSRLQVKVGDSVVLVAVLTFGALKETTAFKSEREDPVRDEVPIERNFEEGAKVDGRLEVTTSAELASTFPSASSALGDIRIAALAAMTRWVGMINPGLHSIFSGLDLLCLDDASPALHFRIASAEARYSLLRQQVYGAGFSGTIDSLMRPAPIQQAAMSEVKKSVTSGEFSQLNALVIGASRGLGEITAKLIAAGGGSVTGTYAVGREEAEKVAAEIRAAEGSAEILPLRLPLSKTSPLPQFPQGINCIFYFATPSVIPRASAGFDRELFDTYIDIYATGFARICSAIASGEGPGVCAFYPSTVYVEDDRPENLTEYAMAKAAGEILCSEMPRKLSRLSTISHRIPRVHTDLSASAFSSNAGDPLEVMLPIVREVKAALSRS